MKTSLVKKLGIASAFAIAASLSVFTIGGAVSYLTASDSASISLSSSPVEPTVFGAYFEEDTSLHFYSDTAVPKVGDTYDGRKVTALYLNVDATPSAPATANLLMDMSVDLNNPTDSNISTEDGVIIPPVLIGENIISSNPSIITKEPPTVEETPDGEGVSEGTDPADKSEDPTEKPVEVKAPWYKYSNKVTAISFEDEIAPVSVSHWFDGMTSLKTVSFIKNLSGKNLVDMSYMFNGCTALEKLDLSKLDVSKVTTMAHAFDSCEKLVTIGDVSGWNTKNVTDMSSMFIGCDELFINCTKWDVSSVTKSDNFYADNKTIKPPAFDDKQGSEDKNNQGSDPSKDEGEQGGSETNPGTTTDSDKTSSTDTVNSDKGEATDTNNEGDNVEDPAKPTA